MQSTARISGGDQGALEMELVMVRAMRRQKYSHIYQPAALEKMLDVPASHQEIAAARKLLDQVNDEPSTEAGDVAIDLLEIAVDDYEAHNGIIVDPESPHWSVLGRKLLNGLDARPAPLHDQAPDFQPEIQEPELTPQPVEEPEPQEEPAQEPEDPASQEESGPMGKDRVPVIQHPDPEEGLRDIPGFLAERRDMARRPHDIDFDDYQVQSTLSKTLTTLVVALVLALLVTGIIMGIKSGAIANFIGN